MSIVFALLAAAAIIFLAALLWAARHENAALRAEVDRMHEVALRDDTAPPRGEFVPIDPATQDTEIVVLGVVHVIPAGADVATEIARIIREA